MAENVENEIYEIKEENYFEEYYLENDENTEDANEAERNDEENTEDAIESEINDEITENADEIDEEIIEMSPQDPKLQSELYHCNVCDVYFPSVPEHVKQYHSEQSVIFEIDENCESYTTPEMVEKLINVDSISVDQNNDSNETDVQQEHAAEDTRRKNIKKKYRKSSTKQLKLKKPKSTEKNDKSHYYCEVCLTMFKTRKSLKLHVRMHNPIKAKTFEETVNMEFSNLNNVEDKETFLCEICNRRYAIVLKDIHMQTHDNKDTFICGICNKKFANEKLRRLHVNIHTERTFSSASNVPMDKSQPSYLCCYCGKAFSRPHEKVKHERVHTGEKPHKCDVCGKSFRVAYCLTLHMRTHTDARPFVCALCGKRFKSQSVYNHHLLTHSDLRPYQCTYCPKAFKTSVQLAGHKNSHTKPFPCPECNRPFASLFAVKNHLESHKRINHNLKHICKECGAVYARGFALRDHMLEHHANVKDETMKDKDIKMDIKTETEIAEQSILENESHENVEIYAEIDQFASEEVITDWLK